jgi:hypothetical protein
MRKYTLLLLVVLAACSGGNENKKSAPVEKPSLSFRKVQGNWLVKEYFDRLNSRSYVGSFGTSPYGITEIVFDSLSRDSVWVIDEEVSARKVRFTLAGVDSVGLSTGGGKNEFLYFDEKTGHLVLQKPGNRLPVRFFHSPDSMLTGSSPASAFRRSLNSALAGHFNAYDPSRKKAGKSVVTLDRDGNVSGIGNYKTYHLYVNGPMANCRDADRIEFSDGRKTFSYGITAFINGYFLYKLKPGNKNEKGAKLEKGNFFMELDRVK